MVKFTTVSFLVASAALVVAHGCADHKPEPAHPLLQQKLERRQRAASSTAAGAASSAPAATATGSPTSFKAGDINTYVPGAPALPDCEYFYQKAASRSCARSDASSDSRHWRAADLLQE